MLPSGLLHRGKVFQRRLARPRGPEGGGLDPGREQSPDHPGGRTGIGFGAPAPAPKPPSGFWRARRYSAPGLRGRFAPAARVQRLEHRPCLVGPLPGPVGRLAGTGASPLRGPCYAVPARCRRPGASARCRQRDRGVGGFVDLGRRAGGWLGEAPVLSLQFEQARQGVDPAEPLGDAPAARATRIRRAKSVLWVSPSLWRVR